MTKAVVERIAERLYMDWNRYAFEDSRNGGELMHWNDLPEYSKDVYRDWTKTYVGGKP